ncbi:MAG: TetR/AcrR family transcriptional regulator [Desulfobacterales bacterium]
MTKREDGRVTRSRLLDAAAEIFAEKGYRDAKVAEICRRADANVAAVNYYFGDKDSLYREAWEHTLESFGDQLFPESVSGNPGDRLRAFVQALIQNLTETGSLGRFSRLYLMEMVNPTGLIQDAWHEIIEPRRRKLHEIIRDTAGPEAGELSIRLCELSIVSQCRIFVTVKRNDLEYMLGRPLDSEMIEQVACHIADFSIAGIREAAPRGLNRAKPPGRPGRGLPNETVGTDG